MESIDVELEQQLRDAGKQLSHPPNSLQLLHVLDELQKLLLKVGQVLEKSILDALKPSINALIHSSLSKHLDIDVRVSVASCICELTRITAPDIPYTDDQMRDVFQLIVSSFEDLADQSGRSYNKRASILETVSKVKLFNIMLDLKCDELIVKMFEHFLKSVRDYHLDAIFSSMENIMVSVIEESEEVSVELLKPLLASVKKDCEGVLPVAHKLGKRVLLKSANKLKPCIIPTLTSLGESLDMYHKDVAAVCEGTTADMDSIDDNDSGLQAANECKLKKGSLKSAVSNEVTDADKLKENSQTEKVFINVEKEADTTINLVKKGTSKKKDDGKKRKRSTGRDKVSNTVKYDKSLVGKIVKVWWPVDNMYYEGVISKFYPANKKHKVSYVDGDEEKLDLRTQKWEILEGFSVRYYTEQNTKEIADDNNVEAATTEKDKDTQETSASLCDATATASNEAAKSKGKTPPSRRKSNTNDEKTEHDKEKLRLEDKRLRLEAEKLRIEAEKEQSKIRQEDERMRLEAEKMKLSKKESDDRIMMVDVSVMPEMQRLYFEKLQREIIMRCNHG